MRQGDPLSPQLYVLASELLQYMINKAWQDGLINLPLDSSYGLRYPIIQYADDTLIIMPAFQTQLSALKTILVLFTSITGLKVNFSKSSLVPINISPTRCSELLGSLVAKLKACLSPTLVCLWVPPNQGLKILSTWQKELIGD